MWHDAAACRTFFRELYEREILRVEETGIECHLGNGACYGSECECNVAFHLASSHLSIYHVIVHAVKSKQVGRHLPV